jgi:hypothetical protein
MGLKMDQIIKILAERLEGKGIEAAKIPSCIETILNLSFFYPIPSYRDLNSRMRSFGWINFEIDDHTFKLVKLISDKPELRTAPRYPEFKQAWFKRHQSL